MRKAFGLIGATFAVWIELRLIDRYKSEKENLETSSYAENSVPGSLASGGESMLSSSLSVLVFIEMINHWVFFTKEK